MRRRSRSSLCTVVAGSALVLAATAAAGAGPGEPAGRAFPQAEALFRQDPRWLGADAALSIPLGDGRTLWLFGDTFVATTPALTRSQSVMVRNTIAVQTGADPLSARMTFHWGREENGRPASYFPENDDRWYWPGHGIRLEDGPLVIFLHTMRATPGEGLGFASAGFALALIDDPGVPPEEWAPRIVPGRSAPFDAVPASAVVRDGRHVVAVAVRQKGTHAGALVRYAASALARGDTGDPEWWGGQDRGWIPESGLDVAGPVYVLDDAGSECSVHRDERTGSFVHVASYGFGASTIGLRTAPALVGPWSAPVVVYRPPESDGPRPFVYAAKAHPELVGAGPEDLVVTYAANSFDFGDLLNPERERTLYWPRVVLVRPGR